MKTVGPERPKAWIIEKLVLKLKNRFGTLLGRVRVPMETPTGFASARQDVLICSIYVHRVPQRTDNLLGKQGCALRALGRDALMPSHLTWTAHDLRRTRSDQTRHLTNVVAAPRPPHSPARRPKRTAIVSPSAPLALVLSLTEAVAPSSRSIVNFGHDGRPDFGKWRKRCR